MATEVHDKLIEQQTGQYAFSPEELPTIENNQQSFVPIPEEEPKEPQYVLPRFDPYATSRSTDVTREAAEAGWGERRYDRGPFVPGEDLEERRALEQPGFWKVANGAIKGGVTMGTTAVNTVAGVLDGFLEGGYEFGRQVLSGNKINLGKVMDAGVNNWVSEQAMKIQQLGEELFPNYRTQEERSDKYQEEWYKHILTPNFIGDSFLKNFGFTAGAMVGGLAWSKAIGALTSKGMSNDLMKAVVAAANGDKEATDGLKAVYSQLSNGSVNMMDEAAFQNWIKNSAKQVNKMATSQQLLGSVLGAMGEGTTEGLMAKNEFMENYLSQMKQEYIDAYRSLPELMRLDENNLSYNIDTGDYELNDDALANLQIHRQEMAKEYNRALELADQEGERLASVTWLLNLPVLTMSNTMQFGRMLAGGWKTTRSNFAKVGGGTTIDKAGNIVANYTGRGNKALKALGKAAKLSGTEMSEEMIQGYISSGTKNVADARLTAYNDDGYDEEVLRDFGSWFRGMHEGGWEYLTDTKNWQEGFLGALTGLMGIPGRGYFSGQRGGLAEAINEANEEVRASYEAASVLNNLVNSQEFQDKMKGYVRHNKAEKEMEEALKQDDQYSWRTANDKQLISDVMSFANVGRLNDLEDMVVAYSKLADEDIADVKANMYVKGNEQSQLDLDRASNDEIRDRVKKQANNILDTIHEYRDLYDAISGRMPVGTSKEQIEEMVYTASQIKAFERRFLDMFGEVMPIIEPKLRNALESDDQTKNLKEKDFVNKLNGLRDTIAQIYAGDIFSTLRSVIQEKDANKLLDSLENQFEEGTEEKKKVQDMRKLSNDRRRFYDKLISLRDMSSAEYSQKAKSPDKVRDKVDKDALMNEVNAYRSVNEVKNAVAAKKYGQERDAFVSDLRAVRDQKQEVSDFLDLYDASVDFRDFFNSQFVKIDSPLAGEAIEYLMNTAINRMERMSSLQDMLDLNDEVLPTADDFNRARADNGKATSNPVTRDELDNAFNSAVNTLREVMGQYTQLKNKTRVTQPLRPVKQSNAGFTPPQSFFDSAKQVVGQPDMSPFMAQIQAQMGQQVPSQEGTPKQTPDAPQPASSLPQEQKKVKATISEDGTSATDSDGRQWKVGDVIYAYHAKDDGTTDKEDVLQIDGFETKDGDVVVVAKDIDGKTRKPNLDIQADYLHTAPARHAANKDVEAADFSDTQPASLASDAVVSLKEDPEIEQSEPEGDQQNEIRDTLRTGLPEIDSFEAKKARKAKRLGNDDAYRSADLRDLPERAAQFNDQWIAIRKLGGFENLVHAVKPGDKIQFVIDKNYPPYIDKDGVQHTQILITTEDGKVLNTLPMKEAAYKGLRELRTAIFNAYQKAGNPDRFVFDKKSTVWYKPHGLIRYNYSADHAGEQPLKAFSEKGYSNTGIIMYYDKDGKAKTVRGKVQFDSNEEKRGRIYYVVQDADGYSYPIRLQIKHYNRESLARRDGGKKMDAINTHSERIAEVINGLRSQLEIGVYPAMAVAQANMELHDALAKLKDNLYISDLFFNFVMDNGTAKLRIQQKDMRGAVLNVEDHELAELDTPDAFKSWLAGLDRSLNVKFTELDKGLNSLIDDDVLTTNAEDLRPKGTDVWYATWNGSDFELTQKQQEILEKWQRKNARTMPTTQSQAEQKEEKPVTTKRATTRGRRQGTITNIAAQAQPEETVDYPEYIERAEIPQSAASQMVQAKMTSGEVKILDGVDGNRGIVDAVASAAVQGPKVFTEFKRAIGAFGSSDASVFEKARAFQTIFNAIVSDRGLDFLKNMDGIAMLYAYRHRIDKQYFSKELEQDVVYGCFDEISSIMNNKDAVLGVSDYIQNLVGVRGDKYANKRTLFKFKDNYDKFDLLPKDIQKDILDSGKTADMYDNNPELRNQMIECAGV